MAKRSAQVEFLIEFFAALAALSDPEFVSFAARHGFTPKPSPNAEELGDFRRRVVEVFIKPH